jgi:hypothetical protein
MAHPFYDKAGSLISPGDIFDQLPYTRIPKPLRVARKFSGSLPKGVGVRGELREVFEYGRDRIDPPPNFKPPGEDVLCNTKMAKAIFLTWGSEVEDDQRSGKLPKREWLIAPVFALSALKGAEFTDRLTGQRVELVEVIQGGKSPKYFPLQPLPGDSDPLGYYVDLKRLCSLAATHFVNVPREWRLGSAALNDFYHQLMWFFTRREIFFRAVRCKGCGRFVDLGIVFEGQPVEPEEAS